MYLNCSRHVYISRQYSAVTNVGGGGGLSSIVDTIASIYIYCMFYYFCLSFQLQSSFDFYDIKIYQIASS